MMCIVLEIGTITIVIPDTVDGLHYLNYNITHPLTPPKKIKIKIIKKNMP